MGLTGLLNNLIRSAENIDRGRRGLASNGEEHEGRIAYETGISTALTAFQGAQNSADTQTLILAELAFLQQEMQFCNESDTDTKSSLTQAIQSFEDALRCLKTVEDSTGYRYAETTYPAAQKYRIQGLPKDSFHLACIAHRTRLVIRSVPPALT